MIPTDLPDLKLLQLFDLLYDTRSVTRVAEQLGQSQPTVSIWLARLREHLHDPLFIRTPGGMAPTPQADALIGPCREILNRCGASRPGKSTSIQRPRRDVFASA